MTQVQKQSRTAEPCAKAWAALLCVALLFLASCGEHSFLDEVLGGVSSSSGGNGVSSSGEGTGDNAQGVVGPLIKTNWRGSEPANRQIPEINGTRSTDCTLVAMAQIMKFHEHPKSALDITIPEYTTSTLNISIPSVEAGTVTLDWANMRDSYMESYSEIEANALADLFNVLAKSRETDFIDGFSGSGSVSFREALFMYFGYDSAVRNINRDDYTTEEWVNIMKQQIDLGLPVMYGGNNDKTGTERFSHYVVLDGYDSRGYFHFNFGYGSRYNGFYDLAKSQFPQDITKNQNATINIKPANIVFTGSGTEASPYLITLAKQLPFVARKPNAHYRLANDINISSANWQSTGTTLVTSWIPICSSTHPFEGVFDGNGKVISGLSITPDNPASYNWGLFGVIRGGSVKNLGVESIVINGGSQVGGIAGTLSESAVISNCYTTGEITTNGVNIGGIAGWILDGSIVENCYSTVDIKGGGTRVGGLVGNIVNTTSTVKNSAALNPSVVGNANVERVYGMWSSGTTRPNNIAFSNMLSGTTEFRNKTLTGCGGLDFSAEQIRADGTLGGSFTTANGWTAESGKLPGFGVARSLPDYIW
jgi:hypothetical protein